EEFKEKLEIAESIPILLRGLSDCELQLLANLRIRKSKECKEALNVLQGGLETNSRSRMDKMPEWGKNRIEVEGGFPEDLAHMLVWMKKLEPRHSSLRDPLLEERKLRKDQLQR